MPTSRGHSCGVFGVAVRFRVAYTQGKVKPTKGFRSFVHHLGRLREGAMQVSKGNESDGVHNIHRAATAVGLQPSGSLNAERLHRCVCSESYPLP
jgi:hypothetical protein